MKEKTYTLDELRQVKGIGKKTIERIEEQFDKSEYISEYNPDIHIEPSELVHGDMLEVMNGIPDSSIDMILTDLPYGTTACSWDTVIEFDKLWKQYSRVIKGNGAIVLFSKQPFTTNLIKSNIDDFKQSLIWRKDNHDNPLMAKRRHLNVTEDISVFYKNQCVYNPQGLIPHNKVTTQGRGDSLSQRNERSMEYFQEYTNYPTNILKFSRDLPNIHPTQKPVALLEYLVKTYTNKNEVVLDSTMGAGSTGVACVNTNRQFIGIELDEKYFEIAKNRIDEAKNSVEEL